MNFIEDMHKRQAAVRRALADYGFPANGNAQFMLDAFAAGKYNEPPMPEAVVPPFAVKVGFHTAVNQRIRVEAFDTSLEGWSARGPAMPTKREAIEAWNALWTK